MNFTPQTALGFDVRHQILSISCLFFSVTASSALSTCPETPHPTPEDSRPLFHLAERTRTDGKHGSQEEAEHGRNGLGWVCGRRMEIVGIPTV